MEKTLFTRYDKKEKSIQRKPIKDLTQISSPDFILAEEKRAALLLEIKQASVLGAERFASLSVPVLNNLISHCQLLPETANSYYAQSGGLLDHALNRTEAALTLFRQFVLLEENQIEWSEEQKLWQYALYTAALLQGIGKLQIDYQVKLYDSNGQFLALWNPLLTSLATAGSYYTHDFEKEVEDDFRRRLNLLIARMLMPASGFAWIASNREVLAIWLALLNEDYHGAGTLGAILIRADAIALRRYFNQLFVRDSGARSIRDRVSTFSGGVPESITDLEGKVGTKFIQWLNSSLESGQIMINKPPLLIVPGGMLMCAEIFKLFVREHPEFKNWLAVQSGFLSFKMHKIGPHGETDFRFEQTSNQHMVNGVIFSDYAMVLPEQVKLYQIQTGKITTMSAIELIHQAHSSQSLTASPTSQTADQLLYLSATGKWQAAPRGLPPVPTEGLRTRG